MKFWSSIVLLIFLNFTALPSIAVIFDWEISTTNIMCEEEENINLNVFKKNLPVKFNTDKFLILFSENKEITPYFTYKEIIHLSPCLTLFSPPPEV